MLDPLRNFIRLPSIHTIRLVALRVKNGICSFTREMKISTTIVCCLQSIFTGIIRTNGTRSPDEIERLSAVCEQAAKEKNLKDCDYWGGFVIDEMKVEVIG